MKLKKSNFTIEKLLGKEDEHDKKFATVVVDYIYEKLNIKDGMEENKGIIIICGGTGCGKTTSIQLFINKYLENRNKNKRNAHFLSFEDPIEDFMYDNPIDAQSEKIDYTPRDASNDAVSLAGSLKDALRQKPSLFYVGEIREWKEWEDVIRFAGTGHFTIVTTHAGAIIEFFDNLFYALNANTPAKREFIASKIIGIVHIEVFKINSNTYRIPSIWVGTKTNINAIVVNGIASVLPVKNNKLPGYFGVNYFFDENKLKIKIFEGKKSEKEEKDKKEEDRKSKEEINNIINNNLAKLNLETLKKDLEG